MKRVHFFIHVPYEDPGAIVIWCDNNGYEKSFTRFYEKAQLPDIKDFDMLVIMGGPMSVNDEDKFDWLPDEKMFIKRSIDSGKKVIGICLGAQLIANALGSEVTKNEYKEIGWHEVTFPDNKANLPVNLPEKINTFHWHGDTFKLPEGAVKIGHSEATSNQGFFFKEDVIALQFHPEMTEKMIQTLVNECKRELEEDSPFIQSEKEILENINNISENNSFLYGLLDSLTDNNQ